MGKNLALFIDGTGNKGPSDESRNKASNVYKLFQLCQEPLKHYHEGVGESRVDVLGAMFGFGTKERLKDAYRFLIDNYQQGDNIFLFGFSRGAFAVRLFAGFLGYVGTIFGKPPFEDYLPHVYQIYESSVVLDVVRDFEKYIRRFGENIPPLPIHFIGVWDTVERYFPRRDLPEIEILPKHIDHARQALAIHERRREMEPTLWTQWTKPSTVEQTWFPGAHSDVGGGYADSKLSEAPLKWIHVEARMLHLKLSDTTASTQQKVLHQQRTVGPILKILEGEAVRNALSTKNKGVIGTMKFDQTACDCLLNPKVTITLGGFIIPPQQGAIEKELETVNAQAFELALRVAAQGDLPFSWMLVKYHDVLQCRTKIDLFLKSPTVLQKDKISTFLALYVFLRGDTSFITQGLNGMETRYLSYVVDAFTEMEVKLRSINTAVPLPLTQAIGFIDERIRNERR